MKLIVNHIWHTPRKAISVLITIYQHTLSPDHGPLKHLFTYGYCKHEPTCSKYGRQQILRHGALIGSFKMMCRLLTCHPWKQPSDEKILKTIKDNI